MGCRGDGGRPWRDRVPNYLVAQCPPEPVFPAARCGSCWPRSSRSSALLAGATPAGAQAETLVSSDPARRRAAADAPDPARADVRPADRRLDGVGRVQRRPMGRAEHRSAAAQRRPDDGQRRRSTPRCRPVRATWRGRSASPTATTARAAGSASSSCRHRRRPAGSTASTTPGGSTAPTTDGPGGLGVRLVGCQHGARRVGRVRRGDVARPHALHVRPGRAVRLAGADRRRLAGGTRVHPRRPLPALGVDPDVRRHAALRRRPHRGRQRRVLRQRPQSRGVARPARRRVGGAGGDRPPRARHRQRVGRAAPGAGHRPDDPAAGASPSRPWPCSRSGWRAPVATSPSSAC